MLSTYLNTLLHLPTAYYDPTKFDVIIVRKKAPLSHTMIFVLGGHACTSVIGDKHLLLQHQRQSRGSCAAIYKRWRCDWPVLSQWIHLQEMKTSQLFKTRITPTILTWNSHLYQLPPRGWHRAGNNLRQSVHQSTCTPPQVIPWPTAGTSPTNELQATSPVPSLHCSLLVPLTFLLHDHVQSPLATTLNIWCCRRMPGTVVSVTLLSTQRCAGKLYSRVAYMSISILTMPDCAQWRGWSSRWSVF